MARISKTIPVPVGPAISRDLVTLFANVSSDHFQITGEAFNVAGDPIIPVSARLVTKIQPRGSNIFLEGDQDLDISQGEFYREFVVNGSAIQFQVFDASPEVDRVDVTITVIST